MTAAGISRAVAFASALLIAGGAVAAAQGAPPRAIVPLPGGGVAIAGGITVPGRGAVRRPADAARFSISLTNRSQPGGALDDATALVAALKKAGIDDAAFASPTTAFVSANQFAVVVGTIRKPTLASVRSLIGSVTATLPPAVTVQNVNYALLADDCDAAENAAIVAAQADARARAERIAAAAHVTLGRVISINQVQGSTTPPCPTKPDNVMSLGGNGMNDLSPLAGSFDIAVSVFETVTYEIR